MQILQEYVPQAFVHLIKEKFAKTKQCVPQLKTPTYLRSAHADGMAIKHAIVTYFLEMMSGFKSDRNSRNITKRLRLIVMPKPDGKDAVSNNSTTIGCAQN